MNVPSPVTVCFGRAGTVFHLKMAAAVSAPSRARTNQGARIFPPRPMGTAHFKSPSLSFPSLRPFCPPPPALSPLLFSSRALALFPLEGAQHQHQERERNKLCFKHLVVREQRSAPDERPGPPEAPLTTPRLPRAPTDLPRGHRVSAVHAF